MYRFLPLVFCISCATATFHSGRTTLKKEEQGLMKNPTKGNKGPFLVFWQNYKMGPLGLVKWQEDLSSAPQEAPPDLLQTIRDEIGRLNQSERSGKTASLSVTVYRYERGGFWTSPTAHYELVARDVKGKVLWAADDKVVANDDLAQSLADSPSAIMAREILKRVRLQFGI
jgi:hypothetical protein